MKQKRQLLFATGTAATATRPDRGEPAPATRTQKRRKLQRKLFITGDANIAIIVLYLLEYVSSTAKMHSSYWWGTSLGDLLFKGYSINSVAGLVMTCLGLASLAVLFEAMKVVQATTKQGLHITSLGDSCPNECSPLLGAANIRRRRGKRTWGLLCQTGLYLIQDTLGYLLMLCVMTYNGYFTVAVSLGAGLGYLVFGPALTEIGLNSASKICGACTVRTNRDATNEANRPITSLTDNSEGLVNSVMELNEPVPGDKNPCCQAEMSSMLNVHGEVCTDSD